MKASKPTGARRPRAAPALPAESEIGALDHACKSSTTRSRRARAARKAGIKGYIALPITDDLVWDLIGGKWLNPEHRHDKRAVRAAILEWWDVAYGR